MKELLVISGKGGTGKTSVTAALAAMAQNKVIVDLDVDAPDMHLLLKPEVLRQERFISGNVARVRPEDCTSCGVCADSCAFDAIELPDGSPAVVVADQCEGCRLCVALCPEDAIDFPARDCGNWYVSDTRLGTMVHAQLYPGQENSGRLVSLLRQEARQIAETRGLGLILADGTPGIGCPVISSLSGTDLALCVTEPTPSGLHDLQRVLELCTHFRVAARVLINKADLNTAMADSIESFCAEKGVATLGRMNFDPAFVEAMAAEQVITEFQPQGPSASVLRQVWASLAAELDPAS